MKPLSIFTGNLVSPDQKHAHCIMHLLKVSLNSSGDLAIELFEVFDEQVDYAILSHRWGHAKDEVSYIDMQNGLARQKKAFQKVEACCWQVLQDGFEYVWIDTCCIDKSSSAELSEAINSMYEYYKRSSICYAYLEDVDSGEDIWSDDSTFRSSQWFTRGWTLQEMVAPSNVTFFAKDWNVVGQKRTLSKLLYEITNVMEDVLLHREDLGDVCVSQKMYWASNRRTTRIEDRAYSLIGFFNLSLPIIYGEGKRAFKRLQEEIIRTYFDHTIFAWELKNACSGLLADSPDAFAESANVKLLPLLYYNKLFGLKDENYNYTVTNLGLEIQLPYGDITRHVGVKTAFLAATEAQASSCIPIFLRQDYTKPAHHFFRTKTSTTGLGTNFKVDPGTAEKLKGRPKFWVAEPKESLRRSIKELVDDDVFEGPKPDQKLISDSVPKEVTAEQEGKAYCSFDVRVERLSEIGGARILGSFPMPQRIQEYTGSHKLMLRPQNVWVLAMVLKDDLEALLLVAVIDNKLMVHLEVNNNIKDTPYDNISADEACEYFYKKCISSTETPCAGAILKKSTSTVTKSLEPFEDDDLIMEIYYHTSPLWNSSGRGFEVVLVGLPKGKVWMDAVDFCTGEPNDKYLKATKTLKYDQNLKELLSRCEPLYEGTSS